MTPPPAMPHAPRPFFRRTPVRVVLAIIVVFAGWKIIGGSFKSGGNDAPAVNVKVAETTQRAVPVSLHAVGNVVAYESVGVRARLDSQVTAVHFKDGDEVKAGDLLFELDDKSLRARAAELEANISRDRAQLENARRQASRADVLAEKGFATKATKDDTSANVAVANASLSASQAALESVRVQLGYTRITAPITGRTGTINVTLGNNVKANDTQPLVTINQLKPIRVQAALPQQHFQLLRDAMAKGTVAVSASKQDDTNSVSAFATGTLDYIDNAVDASTGTFVTRAGFANEDERLLPGMFVTATMTLGGEEQAIIVPEVAIQRGQSGDYVFLIANDKALKRSVKVARLQDNLAVIAEGLSVGERVAVDGLLGLTDGASVKISADAPPAAAPESAPAAAPAP